MTAATAYAPSTAAIDSVADGLVENRGRSYFLVVRGDIRSPYSGTATTGAGQQPLPDSYPAIWLAIPESSLAGGVGDAVCASETVESGFWDAVPDLSALGEGVTIPLTEIPRPPGS